MNLLFGADPEVFYKEKGQLVSALGIVQGTKDSPHAVKNGALQVDGMALEFNIDPAKTVGEWVGNLRSVMAQLEGMIKGEIVVTPIAEFGEEYIQAQPQEAKELGCDPDFNAWTGAENPKPNEDLPFRTGAGHVHIGFTEHADADDPEHFALCCKLVKQLDFYLGLPSLLMDDCTKRRSMYGQAGAFRAKPYGLEYRVLSNFWLASDDLMKWVYNTAEQALKDYKEHGPICDRYPHIQDIINQSDVKAARAIVEAEGIDYVKV
jgi:hypothetical protein